MAVYQGQPEVLNGPTGSWGYDIPQDIQLLRWYTPGHVAGVLHDRAWVEADMRRHGDENPGTIIGPDAVKNVHAARQAYFTGALAGRMEVVIDEVSIANDKYPPSALAGISGHIAGLMRRYSDSLDLRVLPTSSDSSNHETADDSDDNGYILVTSLGRGGYGFAGGLGGGKELVAPEDGRYQNVVALHTANMQASVGGRAAMEIVDKWHEHWSHS